MQEKNSEIKMALKESRVRQWEVAEALNISESTIVRRLRKELPLDEKTRILQVIEQLKSNRAC